MIGSARIKVCGITRAADAATALAQGADFLGVNCWPGSARCVPAAARAQLLREIPAAKRVAVTVNPSVAEATALLAEGFAIVQAHFDPTQTECDPKALSAAVGPARLWLAPKLADGAEWPADLIPLAVGSSTTPMPRMPSGAPARPPTGPVSPNCSARFRRPSASP